MSKSNLNIIDSVKSFILKGRVGDAMNLLVKKKNRFSDFTNEIYSLSCRYNRLLSQEIRRIISRENSEIELNQITDSLLNLLEIIHPAKKKMPI